MRLHQRVVAAGLEFSHRARRGRSAAEPDGECTGGRVEPTLPHEVTTALAQFKSAVRPLVEGLRLVNSPAEIEMPRHSARFFAAKGVEHTSFTTRGTVSA